MRPKKGRIRIRNTDSDQDCSTWYPSITGLGNCSILQELNKNPRKKVEAKKKEINKRKRPNKTKLKYSKVEKENNEKKWSIKKI